MRARPVTVFAIVPGAMLVRSVLLGLAVLIAAPPAVAHASGNITAARVARRTKLRPAPQRHKALVAKAPARTSRRVTTLLRRHRAATAGATARGARLRFTGVSGRDVYNPTRPFEIGGRRVLAARVESRASETDSTVMFFEQRGGAWRPVAGAPVFAMQDPFVATIGGEVVFGGVEIETPADGGHIRYRTTFYRGGSLGTLERFTTGPWGMKDIRLAELDDGSIAVLTRPQGARGGRGKIGFTVARSLADVTPELIDQAPIIEGMFAEGEWGGANEVVRLGGDRLGVLGHIARFDARGGRHYYPMAFELDARRGTATAPRLLLERRDLPGGLRGASKRRDLRDVLFSGGIERHAGGRATLYLGAGDAETHRVDIADPFTR